MTKKTEKNEKERQNRVTFEDETFKSSDYKFHKTDKNIKISKILSSIYGHFLFLIDKLTPRLIFF